MTTPMMNLLNICDNAGQGSSGEGVGSISANPKVASPVDIRTRAPWACAREGDSKAEFRLIGNRRGREDIWDLFDKSQIKPQPRQILKSLNLPHIQTIIGIIR
jgi:hypothetical protein